MLKRSTTKKILPGGGFLYENHPFQVRVEWNPQRRTWFYAVQVLPLEGKYGGYENAEAAFQGALEQIKDFITVETRSLQKLHD